MWSGPFAHARGSRSVRTVAVRACRWSRCCQHVNVSHVCVSGGVQSVHVGRWSPSRALSCHLFAARGAQVARISAGCESSPYAHLIRRAHLAVGPAGRPAVQPMPCRRASGRGICALDTSVSRTASVVHGRGLPARPSTIRMRPLTWPPRRSLGPSHLCRSCGYRNAIANEMGRQSVYIVSPGANDDLSAAAIARSAWPVVGGVW